jgi:two-component system CheB/CheR fusion protein
MTNFRMEEFDKAIINGAATWWEMDLPSGGVFFGEAKAKMLGYPDSLFKNYKDFMILVHPDDSEKAMQAMRDHISSKSKIYETVYRIKNKDGEYIRFYDCGQVVKRNGNNLTVIGFVIKVLDNVDVLEQMKNFKELIIEGNPSIIDLVAKSK